MQTRQNDFPALFLGTCFAGAGVAAGALGAHGLKPLIGPDSLAIFETAVRYQVYHAFALLICGLLGRRSEGRSHFRLALAGRAFTAGILLFSGSLYTLSLTGITWLGAITPLGGVCFLAGWGFLAGAVLVPAGERGI